MARSNSDSLDEWFCQVVAFLGGSSSRWQLAHLSKWWFCQVMALSCGLFGQVVVRSNGSCVRWGTVKRWLLSTGDSFWWFFCWPMALGHGSIQWRLCQVLALNMQHRLKIKSKSIILHNLEGGKKESQHKYKKAYFTLTNTENNKKKIPQTHIPANPHCEITRSQNHSPSNTHTHANKIKRH